MLAGFAKPVFQRPYCRNGHEKMINIAKAIREVAITIELNLRIRRS